MAYRGLHGRQAISARRPVAGGICERCGFRYAHNDLEWQFEWQGPRLQNLHILVCKHCLDVPQEGLRTFVIPQDPVPIQNPRPEFFVSDDNPLSGLGWNPKQTFPGTNSNSSVVAQRDAFFGTLQQGAGVDGAWFGAPNKYFRGCSNLGVSHSSFDNWVAVNWSAVSQPAAAAHAPFTLTAPRQSYIANQAVVQAPINTGFLGNAPTNVNFDGSNDGATWTNIATLASAGSNGEVLTFTIASTNAGYVFYGYHRVNVQGDGTNTVGIASIQISVAGPSAAQHGSELGA